MNNNIYDATNILFHNEIEIDNLIVKKQKRSNHKFLRTEQLLKEIEEEWRNQTISVPQKEFLTSIDKNIFSFSSSGDNLIQILGSKF